MYKYIYMHIDIYMYIHIYIHVLILHRAREIRETDKISYVCTNVHMYTNTNMNVSWYACIHILYFCIFTYIFILTHWLCVHTCIHIHVCIFAHTHTHTHSHTLTHTHTQTRTQTLTHKHTHTCPDAPRTYGKRLHTHH